MSEVRRRRGGEVEGSLLIDGKYLRDRIGEGVRGFFTPYAGLVAAVTGRVPSTVAPVEADKRDVKKR